MSSGLTQLKALGRRIKDACGKTVTGVVRIESYQYASEAADQHYIDSRTSLGVEEEEEEVSSRVYVGDVPLVGDGSLPMSIEGFDK